MYEFLILNSKFLIACEPVYIELHTASAFSFLQGASLPEALVDRAAELGYRALALLDRGGGAGAAAGGVAVGGRARCGAGVSSPPWRDPTRPPPPPACAPSSAPN